MYNDLITAHDDLRFQIFKHHKLHIFNTTDNYDCQSYGASDWNRFRTAVPYTDLVVNRLFSLVKPIRQLVQLDETGAVSSIQHCGQSFRLLPGQANIGAQHLIYFGVMYTFRGPWFF